MSPLQTELAKREYAALTDQQAADKLNAAVIAGRKKVPLADFVHTLFTEWVVSNLSVRTRVDPSALSGDALLLWKAADTMLRYIGNPHVETIDMDLPVTKQALAALVAVGDVPQAVVVAADAMANIMETPAEQLGLPSPVPVAAVTFARKERTP